MKLALSGAFLVLFAVGTCCGGDLGKHLPGWSDYEDVSCAPAVATPKPMECVVDALACGDSVEANNQNGNAIWGDDFYQQARCTPERNGYDLGPEMVWALELPANTRATLRLDSNCADLDLAAAYWPDTSQCPDARHAQRINECEMETEEGSGTITLATVDRSQVYVVGVDGKHGAVGNFRLTVECAAYR